MALNPNFERPGVGRPRLVYIDGVRGVAALYVTLYHAVADVHLQGAAIRLAGWLFQFGHYAVGVFIVLSGYCLMAPVALSADGKIAGGLREYARRRMRRILPAYYAVLIPAVIAVAIVQRHHAAGTAEEADVLRLSAGTLFSHLLLVHNLRPQWATAFDPPMWSVAAECQIYLLFPMLLLPVWRRVGSAGLIVCGFALGMAPHFGLPAQSNLDWTCPWYLGLFALGMAGAVVTFSSCQESAWQRRHVPWGVLALSFGLAFAITVVSRPDMPLSAMWLPDTLLGSAISAGIIHLTLLTISNQNEPSVRSVWKVPLALFESKPSTRLGTCSYSLYLLHAPVLWAVTCVASLWRLDDDGATLARLLVGVPAAVFAAYSCYSLVERRFIVRRSQG